MTPAQVLAHQRILPATLGSRIRARRLGSGLRQAEAVAGAGVSAAYLSRIEHGERRPSVSVLEHIAAKLGVDVDELVGVNNGEGLADAVAAAAARWLHSPANTRTYEDLVTSIRVWEEARSPEVGEQPSR